MTIPATVETTTAVILSTRRHSRWVVVHAEFGFTERQARFLVLVMRHAGLCVPRQYATFAGVANVTVRRTPSEGRSHARASDYVGNREWNQVGGGGGAKIVAQRLGVS